MSRDPLVYVEHMLEAAERIVEFTDGIDLSRFMESELIQDAVERNFEIIGEAAKRVPDSVRELEPDIDWRAICGFRDVISHDCDTVDIEIVWDAVENEIPALVGALQSILARFEDPS